MSSVMTSARGHLKDLMEGSVSGLDRAIPSGRFLHEESDNEGTAPGMEEAPYPFKIFDAGSFDPFGVPSTLSGSHVYRGRRLVVRVAYSPDLDDLEGREQTLSDDEAAIVRCLAFPDSWDEVTVANGGEGISRVDVESSGWEWADVPTPDASQPPGRVIVLDVTLALTIREDHTS